MTRVLVVYLQNCAHPNWVYAQDDVDALIVELKPSGLLWIGKGDPEAGENKRRVIACFPPGGWSGYTYTLIPTTAALAARGGDSRIALPT